MANGILTGELALASISHKAARDGLRRAARDAASGLTVWITRRDGTRVGAVVSVERAEFSRPGPSDTDAILALDAAIEALGRDPGCSYSASILTQIRASWIQRQRGRLLG